MGAQITMELPAMRLLDDEDALDAFERRHESLGLHGEQKPRGDQADIETVAAQLVYRLAPRTRQRTPGDDRKLAIPLDGRPMIAIAELLKLRATLVELRAMITFTA